MIGIGRVGRLLLIGVPFLWLALFFLLPLLIVVNMFQEQLVEALAGAGFIAAGVAVYMACGLHRAPEPRKSA